MKTMTGTEEKEPRPHARVQEGSAHGTRGLTFDALRVRAQQLSLREQLEHQHSLLARLNAASGWLIQAVEQGQVFETIGEIIGNLVGSEEVAIFQHRTTDQVFFPVWSVGVKEEILRQFALGEGLMGRAAHKGASQFRDRRPAAPLQDYEKNLTACVVLKLDKEVIGVVAIFRLLPQKAGLEWEDCEVLKFLETYGAAAVQLQSLQKSSMQP